VFIASALLFVYSLAVLGDYQCFSFSFLWPLFSYNARIIKGVKLLLGAFP